MNFLVNCSNLKVGGGLQVAHSFVSELRIFKDESFVVVVSSALSELFSTVDFGDNVVFHYFDINITLRGALFGDNAFLDSLVSQYNIDRVFTVFGPSYWNPKIPHICGYAKAQYIYKDSPFFGCLNLKQKVILRLKKFLHLYDFKHHNQILITENKDVSERIGSLLKKKVFTVTNNYNQLFEEPDTWKKKQLPFFTGKYLLTISSNYPHKNLDIIPKVICELLERNIRNYKFVVTLNKGDLNSSVRCDEYIEYIGKVDIRECPSLYQQSTYMFLPTLLECFSASYAEAMFMEKIILTSSLGFAKGICKDSAVYFDPLDAKDIVEKLLFVDSNESLSKQLKTNGLKQLRSFDTASSRARKYIEILKYNEANNSRP